jgi:hypothetical protein
MPFYFSNLILQFASSFVLEEHRDLNTGYIPEREGKPYAKRSLLSLRGLLFYLNKGDDNQLAYHFWFDGGGIRLYLREYATVFRK